jgi:hypothetical protein
MLADEGTLFASFASLMQRSISPTGIFSFHRHWRAPSTARRNRQLLLQHSGLWPWPWLVRLCRQGMGGHFFRCLVFSWLVFSRLVFSRLVFSQLVWIGGIIGAFVGTFVGTFSSVCFRFRLFISLSHLSSDVAVNQAVELALWPIALISSRMGFCHHHAALVLIDERPDAGPDALLLDTVRCNQIHWLVLLLVALVSTFFRWHQQPTINIEEQQGWEQTKKKNDGVPS